MYGKSVLTRGAVRSLWTRQHHAVESWNYSSKSFLPSLVYVHFFSYRSFTCRRRYKNSAHVDFFFVTNHVISIVVISGRNDLLSAAYWMICCPIQFISVYLPLPRGFHASLAYFRNSIAYQKWNHLLTGSCLLRWIQDCSKNLIT